MNENELKEILKNHKEWVYCVGGKCANLQQADLRDADLRYVNLCKAGLQQANLRCADLRYANLRYANLRCADLQHANLRCANLQHADLRYANLRDALITPYQICGGELIGWKKIDRKVIKIRIPKTAKRTASLVGRKCRAEYAIVEEIEGRLTEITGGYANVTYRVGETIYPDSYDDDPRIECTHGIHFFQTKEEALEYEK